MRKAALFSLLLCATPLAAAAKPPVVVELFTAQGCASCGEANANLAKMAQREGVQLLDDTAVLRRVSLARNDDGRATLRRLYEFEYSVTGDDRFRGSVTLFGREVEWLDFSAHRH